MCVVSFLDAEKQTKSYFKRESAISELIDFSRLAELIAVLKSVSQNHGRVFLAGNGGSASTSDHFATDLGVGSHIRRSKNIINAISLSSNTSIITALANDTSYKNIFCIQLEIFKPTKCDLVVAISASGNSPNIIELIKCANEMNVKTCALTGFDGGKAKEMVDIPIHVPTEKGEYGIVEDLHLAICHAVVESLRA
jgi:D-sedoheptulose 7-phosphate isomerase